MKISARLLAASIAAVICFALPVFPQNREAGRARALFTTKRSDAMRILLLKVDGASLSPVSPSAEFKTGDQVKIEFESNFDGFVYLVNVTPGGEKKVLFPYGGEAGNSVVSNKKYEFPTGQDVIEFDEEKGTEVLQVIMSRQRIKLLDDAIKNSGGALGATAASAAAELEAGLATEGVTEVIPESTAKKPEPGKGEVRSRSIIIGAGEDKNPQGSFVAISSASTTKKSSGALKAGEIAKFELRLKHN